MVDVVACVLKSGGDFDAEYVERLRDGVKKYLGIRFVCLSDVDVPCERIPLTQNLPGWWSKMELFRPDIEGDIFYLDLDTVIVGDLRPVVALEGVRMLNGDLSAVMTLPQACRSVVWQKWIEDPKKHMDAFGYDKDRRDIAKRATLNYDLSNIGDQAFIRRILKAEPYPYGSFLTWLDVKPKEQTFRGPTVLTKAPQVRLPSNLAAVIFCARPRPRDVNWMQDVELNVA